jgi:nicotinamidase-related amidase
MMTAPTLRPTRSMVLVVDMQERLLAAIPEGPVLTAQVGFLLRAAAVLGVPCLATEQYPQGLGATVEPLVPLLPAERPAKVAFSCLAVPQVRQLLRAQARDQVVLVGIEAHVCVLQTALALLNDSVQVFVAVDAVGSRFGIDRDTALARLERAGVVPTTCETCVFEWLGGADHPEFRTISRLVREHAATRSASRTS